MRVLSGLNGWQRVWLVCSTVALIALGLVYPFILVSETSAFDDQWRTALISDIEAPDCAPYTTKPLASLTEPEYDEIGSRYHLYWTRRHIRQDEAPFTIEQFDRQRAADKREAFFYLAAALGTIAVFCSALVYFFGVVIAWIRRGFAE